MGVKIPKMYFCETCSEDNISIKCFDNLIKRLKMKEEIRIKNQKYDIDWRINKLLLF